jgi:hypothetical protein
MRQNCYATSKCEVTINFPRGQNGLNVKLTTHITCNKYRGQEIVDLYIHAPIRLHAVALSYSDKGTGNFTITTA